MLLAPHERDACFSRDPLRRSPQSYFLETQRAYLKSPQPELYPVDDGSSISSSASSTTPSSPELSHTSFANNTSLAPVASSNSSLYLSEDLDDDTITLPLYDEGCYGGKEEFDYSISTTASINMHNPNQSLSELPPMLPTVGDDNSIENEPTRHVDYLSHDWREEDIWTSWRYVITRRNIYSNSTRLENASWRTWAKLKYGLRTVTPESLNW